MNALTRTTTGAGGGAGGGAELTRQPSNPPPVGGATGGAELTRQPSNPPPVGGGAKLTRQSSNPPPVGGGADGGSKFEYHEDQDLMFIKCEDGMTSVIAGFSKAFTFALAHFHVCVLAPGQTLVTSGDTVDSEKNWTTQHQHYTFPGQPDWVETIDWAGARSKPFPFEPLAFARYAELEESEGLTQWDTLPNGFHSMSEGDITYKGGCFWTCTGPGQVTQDGLEYSGGNIGTSNTEAVEVDCTVFGKRKIRISPLKPLHTDPDGTMLSAQFRGVGKQTYRLVNDSDQSSGSAKYGHLHSQVMVMSNKPQWTHNGITFQCQELAPDVYAIPHFAMVDSKYHDAISPETIASFIVNIDN